MRPQSFAKTAIPQNSYNCPRFLLKIPGSASRSASPSKSKRLLLGTRLTQRKKSKYVESFPRSKRRQLRDKTEMTSEREYELKPLLWLRMTESTAS